MNEKFSVQEVMLIEFFQMQMQQTNVSLPLSHQPGKYVEIFH